MRMSDVTSMPNVLFNFANSGTEGGTCPLTPTGERELLKAAAKTNPHLNARGPRVKT